MSQHADIKAARIAAEKTVNTAPTQANHAQLGRLQALEVKVAELKAEVTRINAAGGITDGTAAAALAALIAAI